MSADAPLHGFVQSPLGPLLLTGSEEALTGLYLPDHRGDPAARKSGLRDDDAFAEVREQLDEYFAGRRSAFDLPLAPRGTAFQQRVWTLLLEIPCGQTRSYGALAQQLGQSGAARAVGLANGQNPISIIVPCHRVIGASGALTGYGGGLDAKRWLLAHESAQRKLL